jgi:hypothetical protein
MILIMLAQMRVYSRLGDAQRLKVSTVVVTEECFLGVVLTGFSASSHGRLCIAAYVAVVNALRYNNKACQFYE